MPYKELGPTKMLRRVNGAFDDSQHIGDIYKTPGDGTWNLAHHHIEFC